MHVELTDLSPVIRRALESVDYHARDVSLEAKDEVDLRTYGGGAGARGFVTVINLTTGKFHTEVGDWGGPGLGNRLADFSEDRVKLTDEMAVIVGTMGHPRTFAHIYANGTVLGRFLPSGEEEVLTDTELKGLYVYSSIKSGYRRNELDRLHVLEHPTIDSLVDRGYLKRNRAGAVQITTKGKNARRQGRFQY
jgi:hypothetical protein